MARTCPSCGSKAIDDQSLFCNKCGSPFPEDQQKKTVIVRTEPRLAAAPLPPPPPPGPPVAAPRKLQSPKPRPVHDKRITPGSLPFKKYIGKKSIKLVYWLGVIAIILISISGISAGFSKTAIFPGNTTDTETKDASGDIFSGIPVFWIGVLVFGNLFWRVVCEMYTIQSALYDSFASPENALNPEYGEERAGESIECPHCGNVVTQGELRSCDHCGVQGCCSCIRMMGLLKKTLTCKDCFERK